MEATEANSLTNKIIIVDKVTIFILLHCSFYATFLEKKPEEKGCSQGKKKFRQNFVFTSYSFLTEKNNLSSLKNPFFPSTSPHKCCFFPNIFPTRCNLVCELLQLNIRTVCFSTSKAFFSQNLNF